jgi:transcriptional regulator with XRE-family HTH domain
MLSTTLKTYRTDSHLSQKEMAANLGISREYYARLEQGKAVPSFPLFERMCSKMDLSGELVLRMTKHHTSRNGQKQVCKLCQLLGREDWLVVKRLIRRMAR